MRTAADLVVVEHTARADGASWTLDPEDRHARYKLAAAA